MAESTKADAPAKTGVQADNEAALNDAAASPTKTSSAKAASPTAKAKTTRARKSTATKAETSGGDSAAARAASDGADSETPTFEDTAPPGDVPGNDALATLDAATQREQDQVKANQLRYERRTSGMSSQEVNDLEAKEAAKIVAR